MCSLGALPRCKQVGRQEKGCREIWGCRGGRRGCDTGQQGPGAVRMAAGTLEVFLCSIPLGPIS
jgi:hypothetical protein